MGQKVHPEALRVGYIHDWKANWFNERHFADYLDEDERIRNHILGKSVPEARAILNFTPRAAARDWSKVLESAVANAEANHELIGDELKIAEAYADEGPTLKRYRPRAMGRATRIRKRTSHLTITLAPTAAAANGRKDR